jgi:hypothetical protein
MRIYGCLCAPVVCILLAMLFVRINAVQCFAEERLNCETLRSVFVVLVGTKATRIAHACPILPKVGQTGRRLGRRVGRVHDARTLHH